MKHPEDVDWTRILGPDRSALVPKGIVDEAAVGAFSPTVLTVPRDDHDIGCRWNDDVVSENEHSV
jgi:hypothetical protein